MNQQTRLRLHRRMTRAVEAHAGRMLTKNYSDKEISDAPIVAARATDIASAIIDDLYDYWSFTERGRPQRTA